ncbi:MAG: hypothetical protein ABIQ61_01615 [Ornithinibacter sp.]
MSPSTRTRATTSRPTTPAPGGPRGRRRAGAPTERERRSALTAGLALLVMAGLGFLAVTLLERGGSAIDAGVAFIAIALLDVFVGCALHGLLRDRALAPAHAVLVSRVGYAVLLAWSAALLLTHPYDGVAEFRVDWSSALLVFGLHLVIVAVALWRARLAPLLVRLATGAAGGAYLLDGVLERFTDVGWRGVLVPVMLGEVVLAGWLVWAGGPLTRRADPH